MKGMRLLGLSRYDPVLFSVGLLIWVAIAFPILVAWDVADGRYGDALRCDALLALVASLCSMGVIVGSPSCYGRSRSCLALIGVGVAMIAICWSARLHHVWTKSDTYQQAFRTPGLESWQGAGFVAAMSGIVLAVALLTFFIQWLIGWLAERSRLRNWSRNRILACLVIFLILIYRLIEDWLYSDAYTAWKFGSVFVPSLVYAIPFVLLVWVLIPGVIASRCSNWRIRMAIVFGISMSGFAFACAELVGLNEDFLRSCVRVGVFWLFATIPLLVVSPAQSSEENAGEIGAQRSHVWSLWSVLAMALILVGVIVVDRYDIRSLLHPSLNKRWEIARKLRQLGSDQNTFFFGKIDDSGTRLESLLEFTDRSNSQQLDPLDGFPLPVWAKLVHLNPDVLLGCFYDDRIPANLSVNISDSTVSLDQVSAFLSCSGQINVFPGIPMERHGASVSYQFGVLDCCGWSEGEISQLLSEQVNFGLIGEIRLSNCTLNLDDWFELVRASQNCSVILNDGVTIPHELVKSGDWSESRSLNQITINTIDSQRSELVKLALISDVRSDGMGVRDFSFHAGSHLKGGFWDAAFVFGASYPRLDCEYEALPIERDHGAERWRKDFLSYANENHWVVSRNDDGSVESMFIPGLSERMIQDLQQISTLKRLSFDPGWINPRDLNLGQPMQMDMKGFANLTELEALYLPSYAIPLDLSFLGGLTNLRELQVTAYSREDRRVDLSACRKLETVILIGAPDSRWIEELSKIPNLKRIRILRTIFDPWDLKDRRQMWLQLPKVEIEEILRNEDLVDTATEEFRNHIKSVTERLRKRVFGEE